MATTLALVEMGSIFAAVWAMLLVGLGPVLTSGGAMTAGLGEALALSVSCLVAFYFNNLYDLRVVPSFGRFASRLPGSVTLAVIMLAGFYHLAPRGFQLKSPALVTALACVGLVLLVRALSYAVISSRPFSSRMLIVGATPLARKLVETAQNRAGYTVVGIVDDAASRRDVAFRAFPGGPLEHLGIIIDRLRPNRVVVALAERRGRLPVGQLLDAVTRRIVIEDGVDVYERLTGKLAIESLMPSRLIFSTDFVKPRLTLLLARLMSVIFAGIGLAVLSPLFVLLMVAIKIDSPGPVFFVQDRVGRRGRRFGLVKFRSMRPRTGGGSEWVRDNGHRITRVGKWLRTFRLDELPQFVNILRGEMNLIGPRPHPVSNFELFTAQIPHYSLRTMIRPGMTGWAQVRYGYANSLEEETEKMRHDLYYIKRMSLRLDLRIVLDTAKLVFMGGGRLRAPASQPPEAATEPSLPELNRAA
jgi:exopolysaccharide biosynthesis polyprenyl glycosylphosphotransferase